jgi:hypothetical protein
MRILTFLLALVIGFGATNTQAAPMGEDKMVAVVLLMDDGDDKKVVTTIFTTLMAAEKVAKALDIEMIISEDPIADDVFVFSLNSPEQKDLTMKMFDEEGYELAGHRVLKANEGNTYGALNVESMADGTYIFEVQDSEGATKTSRVTIKRD